MATCVYANEVKYDQNKRKTKGKQKVNKTTNLPDGLSENFQTRKCQVHGNLRILDAAIFKVYKLNIIYYSLPEYVQDIIDQYICILQHNK